MTDEHKLYIRSLLRTVSQLTQTPLAHHKTAALIDYFSYREEKTEKKRQ